MPCNPCASRFHSGLPFLTIGQVTLSLIGQRYVKKSILMRAKDEKLLQKKKTYGSQMKVIGKGGRMRIAVEDRIFPTCKNRAD